MKPKGKFIIIETDLIRSNQLTSPEKLLYLTLRTYRHNSPPILCNPSLPTLQRATGLSKPTLLKAKRLLQIKGLIKFIPGGGRTITTRYSFPLEEGTEEEIRRLTAYLKAKKTGKKSNPIKQEETGKELNHFTDPQTGQKLNPLTNHKQVKNHTTLQPNSGQKTGKKLNPEQEVSLKKEQQKDDGAASSPSDNQKNQVKDLVKSLVTLGITTKKTQDFIRRYGLENVQKQYTWLFLRNISYPAGALIASLKEDWPEPIKVMRGAEIPKILGPEKDSEEYKKQYQRLKEASKERSRLDMQRRRKGKIGKKLNPYSGRYTGPAPYFADQVPDEICKDCPLQYDSHPLEYKTHGRLICTRRDVKAGLVGVLFGDTNEKTGQKLNQLKQNGIPKRRTQPAIP